MFILAKDYEFDRREGAFCFRFDRKVLENGQLELTFAASKIDELTYVPIKVLD